MLFLTYISDHGTALLWTPPQIPLSPVPTKALHHPPLSFPCPPLYPSSLLALLTPTTLAFFLSLIHIFIIFPTKM